MSCTGIGEALGSLGSGLWKTAFLGGGGQGFSLPCHCVSTSLFSSDPGVVVYAICK